MPDTQAIAITKLNEFIATLVQNLDFELAGKTNPKDLQGNILPGKHQVLNLYRRWGTTTKSLIGYVVLYPITATNKQLTSALEDPIENALRAAVGYTIAQQPQSPTQPTQPTPSAPTTGNAYATSNGHIFTKSGTTWTEKTQAGELIATFEETKRDAQYIYMTDAKRNMNVRFLIAGGQAEWNLNGGAWNVLFTTTPTTAPAISQTSTPTTPTTTAPATLNVPTLPPPSPGDNWFLSAWYTNELNRFSTQPILTWKGQTYTITSPQMGVGLLQQLKSFGATGPLDQYINEFKAVYGNWPNTPPPPAPTTYTPPTTTQPTTNPQSPTQPQTTVPTAPLPSTPSTLGVSTSMKYISYAGSPDVFERSTGRWISYTEAVQKNIFAGSQILSWSSPRPEVKVGSDFALWSGRNLTVFPV